MGIQAFALSLVALAGTIQAAVIPERAAILEKLTSSGACCAALDYFLPGKVHLKSILDLEYQASQLSFWSAQEQSLLPSCIVIPTSTQDVSTAVKILNMGNQISIARCKFAVRGAGHTPHAGSANINEGVTIDMQSMNQVVVSSDKKIVKIGAGNRWGNVFPTLDEMDLGMVGGRVSPVGAGGLITGGGISYFSGRYGLACDNIETFEVVLANGTIATASSNRNSDLYKALKGGSNNFGIVTRFDAKLFPQKAFWGGSIAQPITVKDDVISFFTNFTSSSNFDPYAGLISDFAWLAGIPSIIHQVAYTDSEATWPPPSLAELDALPKVATTIRKAELSSFTNELAATLAVTNGRLNLFTTSTFINRPGVTEAFMSSVYDLADQVAKEFLSVVGIIFTMSFQPVSYAMYSKSAATGGNVLGLDRFTDDTINVVFTVSWQLPLDSARVEARVKKLEGDIVALAKQRGIFNEFIYLNYAAPWQDPIRGYGQQNVAFMKAVSKRYDPGGLFQKGVPGGFKVGL
ncbi:putative oxidoreductase [Sporormia fimetaria CBS 119925]|uniref:Oxidoreductase n=1 Tax=Sporormia fimetaria CBS 119925 TaxID=1340428 RepID=A0A6A6VM15_9PLEO|nr:putative oxidoreductase [Sporormia fimetaria CBS 119925]